MSELFDGSADVVSMIFDRLQTTVNHCKQENKILKENAEHNEKVVDKVNWENQLLKKEIHQLKEQLQQKEDIINKSKEHLELKVIRYSNETNYRLDETDLKEIIQILDNKGEMKDE